MPNRCCLILLAVLCTYMNLYAQEDTLAGVNTRYLEQVSTKADKLERQLDKHSQKILSRFARQEAKLKRELARKDSAAAMAVFGDAAQRYEQLQQKLDGSAKLKSYLPSLDTLHSSLRFLQDNPELMAAAKEAPEKLKAALSKVSGLESEFQKAEEINKFIRERARYLKDQLSRSGLTGQLKQLKQLKQLNKEAYYYSARVNEYKALLKDHKKAEQKALELLGKTKLFREFMKNNSQLASLFRLPGSSNAAAAVSLAGLQTRAQVNGLIQQQLAAGGPNAQAQFSQNLQQAQAQLSKLKDKLSRLGSAGEGLEMPEGFKPNGQKTKSFFQRIELGANLQSQKSNGYFPVTSDLALTAGYKLSDNSVIGIGASYKMGWGENIRNIRITHQGVGLRSFIDVKLKGSFWLTGGYELNYRSGFERIAELRDRSGWQESGLIGVSKVLSTRSKLLKKTKLQLLWDFMSYRQVPKPAAVLFRIGYGF